jgi:hypothetical protein
MAVLVAGTLGAQSVHIDSAPAADFPALVDSNSPAYRSGSNLYLYNSLDLPIRSEASDSSHFSRARAVFVSGENRWRWIESVWADPNTGSVYAWYHAEPLNICPGLPLTAPQIGALVADDGITFRDLGIILRSGDKPNCATNNIYFAGGHGDFSVIPDRDQNYFYFLFTNYGGPVEQQGVGMARMAFADRDDPAGKVWKFYAGEWTQPGLRGRVQPIFPAKADWADDNPDSFWGPAVHWNTALQQYVVLMSHVQGDPAWSQEGVYISLNPDLSKPTAWTTPAKIIEGVGWYPQVLGDGPDDTDTIVGGSARLYVMGHSEWSITFLAEGSGAIANSAVKANTVKQSACCNSEGRGQRNPRAASNPLVRHP